MKKTKQYFVNLALQVAVLYSDGRREPSTPGSATEYCGMIQAYMRTVSGHVISSACCSFGQASSLLWTHTLRPFYSRPIALTQEGRSLVNDVCMTEG